MAREPQKPGTFFLSWSETGTVVRARKISWMQDAATICDGVVTW